MLLAFAGKHNDYQTSQTSTSNSDSLAQVELNNDVQVKIQIGNESQSFSVRSLKRLSYFNAMFSDRWIKTRQNMKDGEIEVINIFGNSKNKMIFGCTALKRLLHTAESGDIPPETELNWDMLIRCCIAAIILLSEITQIQIILHARKSAIKFQFGF